MKHLFCLSGAAWTAIDPHLPRGRPGESRVGDRRVISSILHVLESGCHWRAVPAAYGLPTTISNRFNWWFRRGLWQRVFEAIAATGAVPPELSLDSTDVKAHRSAADAEGGGWNQAPGRLRGGRTPEINCLADPGGRAVAFGLTPGTVAGISMAVPVLEASALTRRLIVDEAYDAESLRRWLKQRRIKAVGSRIGSTAVPTSGATASRASSACSAA